MKRTVIAIGYPIEALEWDGDNKKELEKFLGKNNIMYTNDGSAIVESMYGDVIIEKNYWVITDLLAGNSAGITTMSPDDFWEVYQIYEN